MQLQAVIFDWDGIITDTARLKVEAFQKVFSFLGNEAIRQIGEEQHLLGGISRFERFKGIYRQYLQREATDKELQQKGIEFDALVKTESLTAPLIPGAKETLALLRRSRIPCFVASGTPAEILQELVSCRKMDEWFCEVLGTPPNKEEIIRRLLAKYKFSPAKTLFFGDSLTDYDAALSNQIRFRGVCLPGRENPFPEGVEVLTKISLAGSF